MRRTHFLVFFTYVPNLDTGLNKYEKEHSFVTGNPYGTYEYWHLYVLVQRFQHY
jgi:hypothetical protein